MLPDVGVEAVQDDRAVQPEPRHLLAQPRLEPLVPGEHRADDVETDLAALVPQPGRRLHGHVHALALRQPAQVQQADAAAEVGPGSLGRRGPGTPLCTTCDRAASPGDAAVMTARLNSLLHTMRPARRSGCTSSHRTSGRAEPSASCTWQTTGTPHRRASTDHSGTVMVLTTTTEGRAARSRRSPGGTAASVAAASLTSPAGDR